MFELGNIQNKICSQQAAYTEQNRISNSQKTKASIKITGIDKAEATFDNSIGIEKANIRQGGQNTNNISSSDNSLKDTENDFREKATAFKILVDEIISSGSLSKNISKNLQDYIEEIMKVSEGSKNIIYAEVGEILKKIRDEIQAINSSEGHILDLRDRIEEFASFTESNLSNFMEAEQKTVEQDKVSELARFSSNRIKLQSQKALQFQANIDPDRALKLLTS